MNISERIEQEFTRLKVAWSEDNQLHNFYICEDVPTPPETIVIGDGECFVYGPPEQILKSLQGTPAPTKYTNAHENIWFALAGFPAHCPVPTKIIRSLQ